MNGTGLGDIGLWQEKYHRNRNIAIRIVRISMTENNFLFLEQQKKQFLKK